MSVLKITSGKLELRTNRGTLIRTISTSGVVDADLNRDSDLIFVVR